MIRLIASDMDGTLLNSRKQLPEETFQMLESLVPLSYVIPNFLFRYEIQALPGAVPSVQHTHPFPEIQYVR